MPQLIVHIDAIARQEQRTMLYLEFHPTERAAWRTYRHEHDPVRAGILAWLDANDLDWTPCGEYANDQAMGSWRGQVCLAVPFDETVPAYLRLRDYLEYPDGRMRVPGVRFMMMSLELANRNARHDEPGYLENLWAQERLQ